VRLGGGKAVLTFMKALSYVPLKLYQPDAAIKHFGKTGAMRVQLPGWQSFWRDFSFHHCGDESLQTLF